MKTTLRNTVYAVLLVTLLAFGGIVALAQDDAQDPRSEGFFLPFIPNIQFAPLYVADANGYFLEAGFDFTYEYGDENIGIEQIAAGSLNFGVVSGDQVLLARAGERPVVYVYQWFHDYPVGILVPSTTDASNVLELTGLTVGIPGRFGASYLALVAMLSANDMIEADIDLQAIGFNAPEIICAGHVQAAVVYANNEPYQVLARAEAGECGDIQGVTILRVTDYTDLVSNGLVTNERLITEEPEAVAAVVAAFDRALSDSINNPALTYLISLDYVENLPASDAFIEALTIAAEAQAEFLATDPTPAEIAQSRIDLLEILGEQFDSAELAQFVVLLATTELWNAEQLGYTQLNAWEITAETLATLGASVNMSDVGTAFTNEFLP